MKNHTRTRLGIYAALSALLGAAAVGCGDDGICLTQRTTGRGWTDDSSAALKLTESSAAAAKRADAGATRLTTNLETDVQTGVPDETETQTCTANIWGKSGETVFTLKDIGVRLSFDCPRAAGAFQAEDLHAKLCDEACSPLVGNVTVRAFSPGCALRGACAKLDAELSIATVPGAPGPIASGSVRLSYSDALYTTCPTPGPNAGG